MAEKTDSLYELLPVVYRQRDAEQGWPLKALFKVMAEQADILELDIDQLYDNWFIETAQDWVVPYIGALVGYQPINEAGLSGDVNQAAGQLLNKILIPRREVANTIRYRRRKGTLALLEQLAHDVAGWPARAVEFYQLLGWTQAVNHVRPYRGHWADLRQGAAMDAVSTPFDQLPHTVDVRRINSRHEQGRFNIPSVGVFVWRLFAYPITQSPAYYLEEVGTHSYTFSVLGNDAPLYTKAEPEASPTTIADRSNVPAPIRRRDLERYLTDYYGPGKSFQIWKRRDSQSELIPVLPEEIVVADLTDWQYTPQPGEVAVDPELGRMKLASRQAPKGGLWVSYHYGFSAEMGGGEYGRSLSQPAGATIYQVGSSPTNSAQPFGRIGEALRQWEQDQPLHAVIEITDSGAYVDQINITLQPEQTLQIRAANQTRPVLRLLDYRTVGPDAVHVEGAPGSHFTLDGILIIGRGVYIDGPMAGVTIRHSTMVPGWTLKPDCSPSRPNEPSLILNETDACVTIERSIIGSVLVNQNEVTSDPLSIKLRDSILDATDNGKEALYGPQWPHAHAVLTIQASTIIGSVHTHAIALAENSIFDGLVRVARRQIGCMRFCYVTPDSRTPRRYRCQPDLVMKAVIDETSAGPARDQLLQREKLRVRPQFNSTQYGTPTYCQLAFTCAAEISQGADDESEMGAFHHLYQPQRTSNLQVRLSEYTPAGTNIGILFAS